MALKTKKPAPFARCGTSETVFAGATDSSKDRPAVIETQARYIERRFHLAEPIARTVAEIHFGWSAAA